MACPYELTTDGFEVQWQTNHLAPFLLVKALLPILKSTAASTASKSRVRIVNVNGLAALTMAPRGGLDLQRPNLEDESGAAAPW